MRLATAGLAASESTIPVIISTAIAASISRSTVHHQLANRVRSTREIMRDSRRVGKAQRAHHGTRGHGANAPLPALQSAAMVYERLTATPSPAPPAAPCAPPSTWS